jgi:predicted AAA+ superfamily ATPase
MRKIRTRLLDLKLGKRRSAFLWGPRKVGKSYWLREHFDAGTVDFIDLLQTDVFAELAVRPALLRERWNGRVTVIDEVQKVPALLDEVHWLIENRKGQFILTGSSARKLRRGHANLLAGRAARHELGPLCSREIDGFDLEATMTSGLLPPHFLSTEPERDLRAYVADYLKEEIAAEGAVRNLPAFAEFLRAAALTNAELLNCANVARDCGVSAKVVLGYFEILEDTLLGARLPPWRRAPKRRLIKTDKFYFFDVGVANFLARRRPLIGGAEFGKSFEHFVWMEIQSYRRYVAPDLDISYWRTSTGQEVDFILGDMEVALECKASARIHDGDLRGLRALAEERRVGRRLVISLERVPRRLTDGIEIVPWKVFLEELWAGELVK